MPLTSIYNAVRHQQVKVRTIQQVLQESPEKMKMFSDSEIVAGKNFSSTANRSSSTSVNAIAREIESSKAVLGVPVEERQWQNCKSLKVSGGAHFCQKFLMKCVKDKCPKKFIDV